MSGINVIVPAWSNDIARILTNIYDDKGQDGVFEYVLDNHRDWDWDDCIPCEWESPVFKVEGFDICAVCFSEFENRRKK